MELSKVNLYDLYKSSTPARIKKGNTAKGKSKIVRKSFTSNIDKYTFEVSINGGGLYKGFLHFFGPRGDNKLVKVSCSCKDFMYRFEAVNAVLGASELLYSNGKLPEKTNPDLDMGLCKHLIFIRKRLLSK